MTNLDEEKICISSDSESEKEKSVCSDDKVCFFGGDISFEEPQIYDDTQDKNKKIRTVFSTSHFALFVYLLTSQGVATLMLIFASLFFVSSGSTDALSTNNDFLLGLNAVCQYLIAFPIFFLLTRGISKKSEPSVKRLRVGELLCLFVVAEGVMLLGAFISGLLSDLLGRLFGTASEGAVESAIGNASPWVVFIAVCILAPIFEEIIFRKILIDRLSVFGDGIAIIFSAIAFGLFHGNLSQLIYATAVGLVLGYVYTYTRKIEYTVILHAMLNLFGGVIPIGIEWLEKESERLHALAKEGEQINTSLTMLYDLTIIAYGVLTVLFVIGAITVLSVAIVKRKIHVEASNECNAKNVVKIGITNAGFILFAGLSAVLIIISLLTT